MVDIENSIGIDAWKDFINNHQNNVQTVGSFSSGDYSFKYGVYYSFDKPTYRSTTYPYVEIYYKGELLRTMNGTSYTTNQMNQIKHDEIRSYYNEMCKTIYYDDENKAVIVATVSIPPQQFLLGSYIKDDVTFVSDSIGSIADVAIAGTNIGQLPVAADGAVTLPDGTKVYPNSDGTYNIDNSVYSPTYNLSAYDDTALLELLQTLIDTQTADSVGDTTTTNYNSVLGKISSKISSILTAIKNIPSKISTQVSNDLAISNKVKDKAIEDLKKKVGYSSIQSNVNTISTTFFGERTFNDKGEVIITPVFDTGETITTQRPHLYFMLFGKNYDLFSGFYMVDDAVNTFKSLVSFFLKAAFVLGFFRSLPSILLSFSEVKSITSPTVITNTFSNFGIFQTPNSNKPPKPPKANGKGG